MHKCKSVNKTLGQKRRKDVERYGIWMGGGETALK